MKVTLNTGSTIVQGIVTKGGHKMTTRYRKECGTCRLNTEDFNKLGKPEKIKVTTKVGSVVVFASADEGIRRGEIFIPRGPWANAVVSEDTFNTGSCFYKGMPASIEASDSKVLECDELMNKYYC